MTTLEKRSRWAYASFALSVVVGSLGASSVYAQGAVPPARSDARNDDVVRLKSGALYRGTISQLVPDDHVEILLLTGESKSFPMFDVDYAGALARLPSTAAAAPPSAPASSSVPAPVVHFQAMGDAPPLTLGEVTGDIVGSRGPAFTYRKLCVAPCTPDLSSGAHRLVLFGAGSPTTVYPAVVPPTESTVRATVKMHSGARMAGGAILLGSVVGGSAITVIGVLAGGDDPSLGVILSGPAVIIGGLALGLGILIGNPDDVHVEVLPGLAPAPMSATAWLHPGAPEVETRSTQGLRLKVRF